MVTPQALYESPIAAKEITTSKEVTTTLYDKVVKQLEQIEKKSIGEVAGNTRCRKSLCSCLKDLRDYRASMHRFSSADKEIFSSLLYRIRAQRIRTGGPARLPPKLKLVQ